MGIAGGSPSAALLFSGSLSSTTVATPVGSSFSGAPFASPVGVSNNDCVAGAGAVALCCQTPVFRLAQLWCRRRNGGRLRRRCSGLLGLPFLLGGFHGGGVRLFDLANVGGRAPVRMAEAEHLPSKVLIQLGGSCRYSQPLRETRSGSCSGSPQPKLTGLVPSEMWICATASMVRLSNRSAARSMVCAMN